MSEKILILKLGRCAWSKCLFCGYGSLQGQLPTTENLKRKFDSFFENLKPGTRHVKVFGSGSFLDEKQIPSTARRYFIDKCKEHGIRRVTIESRPEFIEREKLEEFGSIDLKIGIGLEVADDRILNKLNKGFHLKDFEEATKIIHECHKKVRTYLLVNPPFVTDKKKSLDDSVEYALQFSDSIVLINLLPHYNSRLFKMWIRGEWNFLSMEEFENLIREWKDNPKIETDPETFKFTPKFPKTLRENLSGVGEEFLTHRHFEVWQDYLQRWYQVPKGKDILLFLPCSYKKPYSRSETHKGILEILRKLKHYGRIHQIMLSNAGLIPREFENLYPFNAYDWDEKKETPEIKDRYIEITSERISKFLQCHHYKKILCFLKYDSESYKALEIACKNLNIEFKNLLRIETYNKIKSIKRPLQSEEGLKDLQEGLNNETC